MSAKKPEPRQPRETASPDAPRQAPRAAEFDPLEEQFFARGDAFTRRSRGLAGQ